jgi:branched-chain amino acid transport system substrate-binding protein
VVRRAFFVAACALALGAPAASAATPQQLTFGASDGAKLACSLTLPDSGVATAGVMLFHGLGGKHQDMEPIATQFLAPAGYAAIACDARGHGASDGLFGLDGPRDVQDTRELFDYFAQRIGTTNIAALGISLGGGAVWNAATAGVPFKAIVPIITWTNLLTALAPQALSKSGLVQLLAQQVPTNRWDPQLLAAAQGLTTSADLGPAAALAASRNPRVASITTPTLLIQSRHDFLFDIDQALTAYRGLGGPKALYVSNFGHSPASTAATAEFPTLYGYAVKWFDHFLRGTANGVEKTNVVLSHEPWDGKVTSYAGIPATKVIAVNLPGSTTMRGATGKVVRRVRVTGGPHETFGAPTVTVKYSGAQKWDRLVAVLAVQGSSTPITAGGIKLTKAAGVATIRLMNESVRVAAGKKLVLYLGPTSLAQGPSNLLYLSSVADPAAQITIGKVSLRLPVLKKAVSRRLLSTRHLTAHRAEPGITKTQIVLGATGPLTGSESAYQPVLSGAKAYFDYVNARGGVNGRKIKYLIEDDQYDPSKTFADTQKLVESDKVFAIFNSIGTEHAIAVREYLNNNKVPQLFVGSGATTFNAQRSKYPWTMGLLPSNVGEGTNVGRLIAKQHPNAKIGVLYENDEYGAELLAGLKKGLGKKAKQIVSAQSYALLATDVTQQVLTLRAAGADTFVIFALPKQAIQAFVTAGKIGWKPHEYVTSVSIDPAVMQIVKLNAPKGTGVGAQSTAFLRDPTNPTQKKAAGVKLYLQIMKRYLPNEDPRAVAHIYGMMAAYAMVEAIKQAGKNPTRASLLKAATHLDITNPFLLPGLRLQTSPKDYFPLQKAYQVVYKNGFWNVVGKPLTVG